MNDDADAPSPEIRKILYQHSKADRKAQAVVDIEARIKNGATTRDAVEIVAYNTGLSERSLFTYLAKTKGLPREQWEGVLARKELVKPPKVACHPDALNRFIDLFRRNPSVAACYRQMKAEAAVQGWEPIPSERTLRRELDKQLSYSERWLAQRAPVDEEV